MKLYFAQVETQKMSVKHAYNGQTGTIIIACVDDCAISGTKLVLAQINR
jgi:hypothetical protein